MTPEHIVWWMYTLGSVTCILGGICILLGVLVLAIHLAWKAASNVRYRMALGRNRRAQEDASDRPMDGHGRTA